MINKTNINHGIFALVIQLVLAPLAWLVVKDIQMALLLAGTVASSVFIGREYGQVERKAMNRMNTVLTNKHGVGNFTPHTLSTMYPWHVFRPSLWVLDHYMDMLFPIAGNIAVVLIVPVIIMVVH